MSYRFIDKGLKSRALVAYFTCKRNGILPSKSSFCRLYGVDRKTFLRWVLEAESKAINAPKRAKTVGELILYTYQSERRRQTMLYNLFHFKRKEFV